MTAGLALFLALFLAVLGPVFVALDRDLERADARRRTREALGDLRGRFEALQTAVGVALLPSLSGFASAAVQAAAEFEQAAARAAAEFESGTLGRDAWGSMAALAESVRRAAR